MGLAPTSIVRPGSGASRDRTWPVPNVSQNIASFPPAGVIGMSFSIMGYSCGAGVEGACVWVGFLLAATRPCRLLMSLLSSLDWRLDSVSILKLWLAIVGLFSSVISGGLLGALGWLLHRPGDWITSLLTEACWIEKRGYTLSAVG